MSDGSFSRKLRSELEALLGRVDGASGPAAFRERLRALRERFERALEDGTHLAAIHAYRARGSATLSRELAEALLAPGEADESSALARWSRTNQWLDGLSLAQTLSLPGLRTIQARLTGEVMGDRREELLLDGEPLLAVAEIPAALEEIRRVLLGPVLEERAPERRLAFAVEILSALSYVHPFSDANGRTLRLACDALLLDSGLPPMSFVQGRDAYFIGWFEEVEGDPSARADTLLERALSAMERTVEILERGEPCR